MALFRQRKTQAASSLSSCRDYSGSVVQNGHSFTLLSDERCFQCKCAGGQTKQCINVRCIKPSCDNYKLIPGKCCEYTCPDFLPISDSKQLAVILSLSIVFLVIIILIIVVWKRAKRYKRYSNDIQTECVTTEQDTADPAQNNQRQPSTSSSNHAARTAVTLSSIELPPYAPPKKPEPETVAPCEPPPPYTPQEISFV